MVIQLFIIIFIAIIGIVLAMGIAIGKKGNKKERNYSKREFIEEKSEKKNDNLTKEMTIKINGKTLVIVSGFVCGLVIVAFLFQFFSNGANNGSSATHDSISLNDYNINDYITTSIGGRPTDYSSNSYKSVYLSGSVTSSRNDSECQNVSFVLTISVLSNVNTWGNGNNTDKITKNITLDSGCNYSIATTEKLNRSFKQIENYYYSISDVSGSIIIPKKIID